MKWYKVSETELPVFAKIEIKRPNGTTEKGVFTPDFKFITESFITLEINPKWLWKIPMHD
jgi:hypothetical protein